MEQLPENFTRKQEQNDLRLLPLAVAAMTCFVIAVTSGYIIWYIFGSKSPLRRQATAAVVPAVQTVSPKAEENKSNVLPQTETPGQPAPETNQPNEPEKLVNAPAGELIINSGEVVLGGGDTGRPLKRQYVNSFLIAETEVTNAQFREFIEVTESKIKLPVGKDDEPVTNISWTEAKAYCDWLSRKLGAEVRLPTEAEWELAARGGEGYKYPWGNQWRDDAAVSKETNGKVQAVKSFPLNKSPFGAFDMAGNVWEWTADTAVDEFGKPEKYAGEKAEYKDATLRVVKGGSATEEKKKISAQARYSVPESLRTQIIGFRYVVVRKK